MNSTTSRRVSVPLDCLVRLSCGDKIERYGPFINLTFVSRENGHVTMRDKFGNEKRVYESLFMKHAVITPNIGDHRPPTSGGVVR